MPKLVPLIGVYFHGVATVQRYAMTPYTFKDGFHVPARTVVSFPNLRYNTGPSSALVSEASTFDGKCWVREYSSTGAIPPKTRLYRGYRPRWFHGFSRIEDPEPLLQDAMVSKVHCIAVRKPLKDLPEIFVNTKVTIHHDDLRFKQLGLSDHAAATIFAEASAVVHCGIENCN
ncbi:hypothetical protein E0Z10_g10796 [Xylaria hypoxylon]|uniref:Uncharacterized protein n=1 Tax=Xylaria hypoxylon TaxID=37992 RepID=A0A4Z0YIZ7_9PEZI|nr:hypothetical protein E0Z10_g10796 [Xylaria hypoxylon]